MRRTIHTILAALALAGLLSSCQNKEQDVVAKKALKVVKTEVVFGVEGGEGVIQVEADEAVTATSERAWCQVAVDGNTIHVSVPEANPGRMSRYARIIIKSGAYESHVTAQQYGEVFSGLELEDMVVGAEGAELQYSCLANMTVQLSSDQPWVHFTLDPATSVATLKVDANEGYGYRFATVSYTAGSTSLSAQVIQETPFAVLSGWKVEDADGRFVFPDQIESVTVTPSGDMASVPYYWDLFDPEDVDEEHILDFVKEQAMAYKALADEKKITFCKGTDTREFKNPHSLMKAVVCCFDENNYPTGRYVLADVSIPARGPVKQEVEGWQVARTDGSYAHPVQTDVFTVTPEAGYEDQYYVATVVKKEDVTDVEDFAFNTFAMAERQKILDKVAAGELASFEEGLSKGVSTLTVTDMVGDCYVVVVAFGTDEFYTGDYQVIEVKVADATPAFYRWVGKWKVSRKNDKNDAVDTWTITVKDDQNKVLNIHGIEGFDNPDRYDAEATVDETGKLILKTQNCGQYEDSTRGTVTVLLSGQYTNVQGKTYYSSSLGVVLLLATLSEDGLTADLTPGTVTSAGAPASFSNIQFYGRYKKSDGSTSAITWTAGQTQIEQTITRVVE